MDGKRGFESDEQSSPERSRAGDAEGKPLESLPLICSRKTLPKNIPTYARHNEKAL